MSQRIAHVALIVKDYDEAIAFFTGCLRFELIEDTPIGGTKRWVLVAPPGTGGIALLLAKAVSPEQESRIGNQTGGRVFLFLRTDDFWRDYHAMKSRGITFAEEPRCEAYGTVAVFLDLYGNKWDLVQLETEPVSSAIEHEIVPTQAGYERWAEVYDAEDNPLILLEEEHLTRLLGDVSGLAIIDMGCGTGRHAVRLAAAGARVTAVDFSQAMLQQARMKAGAKDVTFLCHDLTTPLPLEESTFDRVLCCLVADHIADLPALFRELLRLCRPGGFVVFSVMHPAMTLRGVQARFIDPGSGRRLSPASHAHLIADYFTAAIHAGLQIADISEHAVDQELANRSGRARKYLGWPMLLLMLLRKTAGVNESAT